MVVNILIWGLVAGVIHFVVIGLLYGNPFIDKIYKEAKKEEAGVKEWPSMKKYMPIQFCGTQIEVFILTGAYLWLRQYVPLEGISCSLGLGLVFAGIRVYPRFWNMWIQSTYPNRLLGIEFVNGVISTLLITVVVELFV